jgi:hypothetical protein
MVRLDYSTQRHAKQANPSPRNLLKKGQVYFGRFLSGKTRRGTRHITVVGRAAFMQLALRIPDIHKTLAPYPDIKIEFIGAGE